MDTTATTWLAILAISSLIETLVLIAVLVVIARAVSRVSAEVTRLQRDHVEPLIGRVNVIADRVSQMADDVQDSIARLRTADDQIRFALARGLDGANSAVRTVQQRLWPAVGAVRAVGAVVSFLSGRSRRQSFTDRSRHAAVGLHHHEGVPYVR